LIPYGKHSVSWLDAFRVGMQVKNHSLTQGPKIAEFENLVAKFVGAKYAVAVSSATAGLHISVLALKLPPASQIVTSPISFVASSNCILYSGHTPIFIDINPENINLSAKILSDEVTKNPNIRAVIPVHFAGLADEMAEIHDVCNKKAIKIIEDAAHGLGGMYPTGEKIGSCKYSDITVFSTHPVKSITTGEGGIITTNSEEIYANLLRLRSHGINKLNDPIKNTFIGTTAGETNLWYYEMQSLGFHYRLTEIQAALGCSQIKKLNKFMKRRYKLSLLYDSAFKKQKIIQPAQNCDKRLSANHIYPVRIDFEKINICRNDLMKALKEKGILTQVHYIPIPSHPYYSELGYDCNNLVESLKYYQSALTLPLYPTLKKKKQKFIINSLIDIIEQYAK